MAGIEPATVALSRRHSTAELHGYNNNLAPRSGLEPISPESESGILPRKLSGITGKGIIV